MSDLKIITSDARKLFANRDLTGVHREFALGDLQSVAIVNLFRNGETGAQWHIEPGHKAGMIRHLEKLP